MAAVASRCFSCVESHLGTCVALSGFLLDVGTAAWRRARATKTVGDCAAKPPAPPIARFMVDSSWHTYFSFRGYGVMTERDHPIRLL